MVRPLKAATLLSRQQLSFRVSVWMVTAMSSSSATVRQQSMAAGVVPQSSCSLRPTAPAAMMSRSPSGLLVFPFPVKPKFMGMLSVALSMALMWMGAGVQVVALVPVVGPVPPPSSVVRPLVRASVVICGQMKWTCVSMPPAVSISPSPAMTSVLTPTTSAGSTPAMVSGFPALPMPQMKPSLTPTSALKMPEWSTTSAFVMTRSRVSLAGTPVACPMPSRMVFPPPNLHSSP
mmetsp:Transcript_38964/g.99650  ORF Transcript_38964/g.99650 Transcript_38964/m.99650 type:complete len:233 (+) Transcript_38964:1193-1891(+)